MKNKIKILYNLFKTFFHILLFSNIKINRYRPKKENNIRNCIIISNGPTASIFLESFQELKEKNDFVICMNDFALSEYYIKIRPSVYFLSDPAYFNVFNSKEQELLIEKFYQNIIKNTSWPLIIRIPWVYYKNKTIHHILKENPNLKIEFFNNVNTFYPSKFNFYLYDWGLCKPLGQNILISVILYGIFQDFKHINLYGADHTWLNNICINSKKEVCLYNDNFIIQKDMNNKEKDFKPWVKAEGGIFSLPEILTILTNVFKAYHELQKYANSKNCEIVNHSNHTLIDAFKIT